MKSIKIHRRIIWLGIVLMFFSACSTQKNTFVNRNYHSITTKYNGYFNARESYRDGVKRLESMHEDNYDDVLNVFRYGTAQNARSISSNMDVAYQKASTAIRRHSMSIRGVEYNRWIDDSFFLIARSHYFKRDFNLAILTFEYIIRQYDTPLKFRSKIWVAKSYVAAQQFTNAQQALDRVTRNDQEGLLDRSAQLLFNKVYADFHLKQNNFGKAAPYLEKAIELAPRRKEKARLTFILAQAYHRDQNFANAQRAYARVLRYNPDFQMAFQSRINMAMAFDVKTGDSDFILGELQGMLKNNRNREFRDQIYYALGQFSMRQQKEKDAIDYYQKSIEHYIDNKSQKGMSFLRLGEIYFARKEYLAAANYYDSTMAYISHGYHQIEAVANRNALLQDLSRNIKVVHREDSLQRIAALSPNERNIVLDGIIAEIELKAQKEREIEEERARMRQDMARRGTRPAVGEGEGGWYFYNPSAISFGQNEFYARWGNRRLEDLWRISNKRIIAFGETDASSEEMQAETTGGRVTRSNLMADLPTTPEKKQASDAALAKAIYNKGLIYKNNLQDYPNAIRCLEMLVNRFPKDDNVLYGAYFLVTLFQQTGNPSREQVYKNMIINNYPDTDFARILSDPNYAQNIKARQQRSRQLYERAYFAYTNSQYEQALALCIESESLETDQEQAAQFSFLKALITGKIASKNEFRQQLIHVTDNYKGTLVHEPASNLLAFLGTTIDPEMITPNQTSEPLAPVSQLNEPSPFTYNPNAVHFYVLIVNTRNIPIRQVRNLVNNFNRSSYPDSELNISTLFFDEGRQLVTITNFTNSTDASTYGEALMNSEDLKNLNLTNITPFSISVENYPLFYQERKLDEYLKFYSSAYN